MSPRKFSLTTLQRFTFTFSVIVLCIIPLVGSDAKQEFQKSFQHQIETSLPLQLDKEQLEGVRLHSRNMLSIRDTNNSSESSNSTWELSSAEKTATLVSMIVLCSVSIVGTLFVGISYIRFHDRIANIIPFFWTVSVFFLSVDLLIPPLVGQETLAQHDDICIGQAAIFQYCVCAVVWWGFLIILQLHLVVCNKIERLSVGGWAIFHIIGWGLPFIQAIFPAIFEMYRLDTSSNSLWCWITGKNKVETLAWQFTFLFGVMALSVLVGLILWVRVFITVRRIAQMDHLGVREASAKIMTRINLFIFMYLTAFSIITGHWIFTALAPDTPDFVWLYLHIVVLCSLGIMDFVAFGATSELWKWWGLLCRSKATSFVQDYHPIIDPHYTVDYGNKRMSINTPIYALPNRISTPDVEVSRQYTLSESYSSQEGSDIRGKE